MARNTSDAIIPTSQGALWVRCRSVLLPALAVVAVLDVYAVWFLGVEQTLYHADQVTYWSYSQHLAQVLVVDPVAAIRAVVHSVASSDVNLLPALPIACVMAVFGDSRLVYLLSVINIYGAATVMMLVVALRKFGLKNASWVAPLVFLLTAVIWRPIFIGYLGIGGVALALGVLALSIPSISSRAMTRSMVLAGVLLALLVLFRRWWGIWAVAFCIVVLLAALWELVSTRARSLEKIREVIAGPAVLGLTAFVTLIVLAAPIVVQRLTTDYADRFAAYSLGGVSQRVAAVVGHFGMLGLLLIVGCTGYLLSKPILRRSAVALVLLLVLTYAIMVSIQDHSPQHWYLYDPSILLLVGLALGRLGEELPRHRRVAVWASLVVVGLVTTASVFGPGFVYGGRAGLLPSDRVGPRVRGDLAEIDRLLTFLDHRYEHGTGRVYILASSELLSDQVLAFSNLSLGTEHPSVRGIIGSAHVDRRDGFPRGLLVADAVVVTDPIQVHLRADEQRVIVEPARSFLEGTDIAHAFQELSELFVLDDGVMVRIFERVRLNTPEEIEGLSSRLRDAYPDRPEIYKMMSTDD